MKKLIMALGCIIIVTASTSCSTDDFNNQNNNLNKLKTETLRMGSDTINTTTTIVIDTIGDGGKGIKH